VENARFLVEFPVKSVRSPEEFPGKSVRFLVKSPGRSAKSLAKSPGKPPGKRLQLDCTLLRTIVKEELEIKFINICGLISMKVVS